MPRKRSAGAQSPATHSLSSRSAVRSPGGSPLRRMLKMWKGRPHEPPMRVRSNSSDAST
jgi:hypothetical protein